MRFPARTRRFSPFPKASRPDLESTHPLIQWVPGALPCAAKWLGREVDHSAPSSAEVQKEWSYNSTPSIRLPDIIRDNLTSETRIRPIL